MKINLVVHQTMGLRWMYPNMPTNILSVSFLDISQKMSLFRRFMRIETLIIDVD